jgi:predicted PurR-regulated permease PerM
MTYFLLASNRMLYEKLVRASPKLKDKKKSISIVYHIENIVSKYLLTITMINAGFGLTIGIVMWLLGMPSPVMWGVAGFFLNYLPFVGSAVGTISAGLVALVSFDSIWWALIPPLAYFSITTTEGQFITPAILGHRLELNPVAILTSIAFWGFLWGVAGVILAVPILIVMKVFSDNIEAMSGVGEFLSGSPPPLEAEERPDPEAVPNLPSAS